MATPSKANANLMWHKKKPVIRFITARLCTLFEVKRAMNYGALKGTNLFCQDLHRRS